MEKPDSDGASRKRSKKEMLKEYRDRKEIGGVYSIRNERTERRLIQSTTTITKAESQLAFARATGLCVHPLLADDWKAFGPEAFTLEILETLEKKDTETPEEFTDNVRTLETLWKERFPKEALY